MFIPIGTDAPLYHRPFATVGLIAANFWAFVVTQGGMAPEGWLLTFGNGLHPTEWVMSAFLHFGIMHLLGNMIFLFIFGMIIEGKIGPFRFLALYFAVCVLDGMVGQVLMLGYTGESPGAGSASGAIFALMMIAWLWAPQNEIEVLLFVGIWAKSFEVTLQTAALYYLGTNLFFAWLMGFEISSEVLHLMGAGVGFPIGLLFLKKDWVDCEGWDLISLRGGKSPKFTHESSKKTKKTMAQTSSETEAPSPNTRLARVEKLISLHQFDEAFRAYDALKVSHLPQSLSEMHLESLIKGLVRNKHWREAVSVLEESLQRFERNALRHRLALASILVRQLQRPKAALNALQSVEPEGLDPESRNRLELIHKDAMTLIEQGVLEIHE